MRSSLKVVTVGHNPSDDEFDCEEDRFEELETRDDYDTAEYLGVLNKYFREDTDYDWFDDYEEVLQGLGASYYTDKSENVALHTDLQSPLATTEQWSKLPNQFPEAQQRLKKEGRDLWYSLIESLRPDLILASLPIADVKDICNQLDGEPTSQIGKGEEIYRIRKKKNGETREKDYVVRGWSRTLDGNRTLVVYGEKAEIPFGSITHPQKREVGCEISSFHTNNI